MLPRDDNNLKSAFCINNFFISIVSFRLFKTQNWIFIKEFKNKICFQNKLINIRNENSKTLSLSALFGIKVLMIILKLKI